MGKTAILVDGAFFLKRYRKTYQQNDQPLSAEKIASDLYTMCFKHLDQDRGQRREKEAVQRELYRIFFYDCVPLTKKVHYPVSKKSLDFATTETAKIRLELHRLLKQKRKVALRLGHLSEFGGWEIKPQILRDLLNGKKSFSDLADADFNYQVMQKTVDMKIGLDVASLAYKNLVDQIILISGDGDFVPAAKLARREGVDFILDPMHMNISDVLSEHIDGLWSTCPRPRLA